MHDQHQLLFIQGGGADVHDEWDSKLVESLRHELGQDFEVRYPRLPREEEPNYASWREAIEQAFAQLRDGAILVAHSVGATILIKMLAERSTERKFGALIFIAAPFIGDGGWSTDDLQFPADLGAHLPPDVPIHFFHGLEDQVAPPSHMDLYARVIPRAHVHRVAGRDHQLDNDLSGVARTIRQLTTERI